MYVIGIVGHGKSKFTPRSEITAKRLIRKILSDNKTLHKDITMCSGHSPVGGIDIWAEEIAIEMNIPIDIKSPKTLTWNGNYGYKARNIDIAETSDEVHCILVDKYPPNYKGMKFTSCYHCDKHQEKIPTHVKSGGCWTTWRNKHPIFHVIHTKE
jgi:hypothetical protein